MCHRTTSAAVCGPGVGVAPQPMMARLFLQLLAIYSNKIFQIAKIVPKLGSKVSQLLNE